MMNSTPAQSWAAALSRVSGSQRSPQCTGMATLSQGFSERDRDVIGGFRTLLGGDHETGLVAADDRKKEAAEDVLEAERDAQGADDRRNDAVGRGEVTQLPHP